jgi:hypothetical protein
MRRFNAITAAVAALLLLAGCGILKKGGKPKTSDKPAAPQGESMALIGIVEMVNPEQRYVLIRCQVLPNLPAGTELTAYDATGAASKLVLTPERKGVYLTADVKAGSPQVSNMVMLRRSGAAQAVAPLAPTPPPTPLPAPVPAPVPIPAQPTAAPLLEPPLPSPTLPLVPPGPTATKPAP